MVIQLLFLHAKAHPGTGFAHAGLELRHLVDVRNVLLDGRQRRLDHKVPKGRTVGRVPGPFDEIMGKDALEDVAKVEDTLILHREDNVHKKRLFTLVAWKNKNKNTFSKLVLFLNSPHLSFPCPPSWHTRQ